MNGKEFVRKRSCPNCVTVLELTWRDYKSMNVLGQGSWYHNRRSIQTLPKKILNLYQQYVQQLRYNRCDTHSKPICFNTWLSRLFMAKGHTRYYGLFRGPHIRITVSGITNCLNHCEIFIVCMQVTDMVAGRRIQPGGPRVGVPCFKGWSCIFKWCTEAKEEALIHFWSSSLPIPLLFTSCIRWKRLFKIAPPFLLAIISPLYWLGNKGTVYGGKESFYGGKATWLTQRPRSVTWYCIFHERTLWTNKNNVMAL